MKAIIFDMDGVLIDSEKIYCDIEQQIFDELGLEISDELRDSFVGMQMHKAWEIIKSHFDFDMSIEEILVEERKRFQEQLDAGAVPPVEGAYKLMKDIKKRGYKTAVASSSYRKEIEIAMEIHGYDEFLDHMLSGEDVKNGKPNPDIFLLTSEKLGTQPEECVVIEDSENGVNAAKAAKMLCIGYRNVDFPNQDLSKADLVVDSFINLSIEKIEALFD